MNKKQAVKEIRDIILKYIFIEIEKMEDYDIEVKKRDASNEPYSDNEPHIDIELIDVNFDYIVHVRIRTSTEDSRIYIYECPDSLYDSIINYDNYKFSIVDCRC